MCPFFIFFPFMMDLNKILHEHDNTTRRLVFFRVLEEFVLCINNKNMVIIFFFNHLLLSMVIMIITCAFFFENDYFLSLFWFTYIFIGVLGKKTLYTESFFFFWILTQIYHRIHIKNEKMYVFEDWLQFYSRRSILKLPSTIFMFFFFGCTCTFPYQ